VKASSKAKKKRVPGKRRKPEYVRTFLILLLAGWILLSLGFYLLPHYRLLPEVGDVSKVLGYLLTVGMAMLLADTLVFGRIDSVGEAIINLVVFGFIYWHLLSAYPPGLMLSNTTTTGGDMVGYYYMTHYLTNYLLPHGKILGWAPGWFAGFPMFQFYFPLVFIISALMAQVIPIYVSFKIASSLGVFLLPVACFACFKLFGFKFPFPVIGAVFSLPFVFLEHYSMWGGNIPSTLAGEFSYGFSLCLMLVYFGLLYRGITQGKYWALNGFLFHLIILSHGITTVFAGTCSLFYLLTSRRSVFRKNFLYLAKVYILAVALAGYYFLPIMTKTQYSISHIWLLPEKFTELVEMIFPEPIWDPPILRKRCGWYWKRQR